MKKVRHFIADNVFSLSGLLVVETVVLMLSVMTAVYTATATPDEPTLGTFFFTLATLHMLISLPFAVSFAALATVDKFEKWIRGD